MLAVIVILVICGVILGMNTLITKGAYITQPSPGTAH